MTTINLKQYNLQVSQGFVVGGFNDLGNDITNQFKAFYNTFFALGLIQLTQDFLNESERTFLLFDKKQRVSLGDAYFNNFTVVTGKLLSNGQYGAAFSLWTQILSFVKDWEKKNKSKRLHKGTPYYFSAVSSIMQNDFDAALISMHNALVEDKINNSNWDQAPGYFFMTLNDQNGNQYFKPFVDAMIGFIRDRLDGQGLEKGKYKKSYAKTRSGILTYPQFRSKFLDDKNISEEIKYYFVYSIIRIWHLRVLHKNKVGDKLMAPLIFNNALFSLLLVIDDLMKTWNNMANRNYISEHVYEISKSEHWIHSSINKEKYIEDLDINNRLKSDFEQTCRDLIRYKNGKYKTKSNRELGELESDFVLVYGLRNFSAHNIKSQEILWKNYTEILQSVLNCLFKVIEII